MYGDVSRYGKVILFGMYHWNKIVSIEVGGTKSCQTVSLSAQLFFWKSVSQITDLETDLLHFLI